jgi:hypothetical protein
MSNRSSNRPELRVLGSFRNFAHRQEAVGSFRKSLASLAVLNSQDGAVAPSDNAPVRGADKQNLAI